MLEGNWEVDWDLPRLNDLELALYLICVLFEAVAGFLWFDLDDEEEEEECGLDDLIEEEEGSTFVLVDELSILKKSGVIFVFLIQKR